MRQCVLILIVFVLFSGLMMGEGKRPFAPEDLYKVKGVSDPQISPDGKWIAFTIGVPDLAKNSSNSDIWLMPITGGALKQLTASPKGDHSPRFSPDGRSIAFISSRNGVSNIFIISLSGGEAQQLTHAETSLYSPIWSKDGTSILCGSRVLPKDKTDIENWTKEELPKCEARSTDRLLFRQWDRWLGDKRNHLFVVDAKDGSMRDITPEDADVPPVSLSGSHDFAISPKGDEVCFVRNDDPVLAVSTNHDLFIRDMEGKHEIKLTSNRALDRNPHYSPNGRYIAYAAMKQPGYEADREVLTVYDRVKKTHRPMSESLDRSVAQILWSPDSKYIYFTCRDQGHSTIFRADLFGNVKTISHDGYNLDLALTPNGKTLIFRRSYNHMPYELFSMPARGGAAKKLTSVNAQFLAKVELPKLEEFWFKGADDTMVHGYVQRPVGFDPNKKYPVVLTIHGGPQNMWSDRYMSGWFTFPLASTPGYVGLFINPRGSTGYGSKFRGEVSKDYGGRCYEDLMKGLDYAIEKYPFIDGSRCAAIGGSFGGYSVNWIMGNTNRFKCIVSHASLYNLTSFYGATEELWFPAWDMGETPWDEPELYARWSPHRLAKNFKTPTLVTHGLMDFRVPYAESLQLFTALQRQGIPSRLVTFPDEGHVIGGPQNNVRWWKEIHRWLKKYL
jgi:dipeptidyl aminopeptidase/acylaminoacyl peptidase